MSKTVFIPECMNPFEVIVNHHRYIYPGGTSQEVPDEVAEVIELHNKGHEERKPPVSGGAGGGNTGGGGEEWFNDGNTHIWITLPEGRTSPMLGVCPNGTVTVDWGDGTEPDVLKGTTTIGTKWTPSHEYAKPGDYIITLTTDGNIGLIGDSISGSKILRHDSTDDSRRYAYQTAIKRVELGSHVTTISSSAFNRCYALASVMIPNGVESISSSAFTQCYALASVMIPNGVKFIDNGVFYDCYSLSSVSIPDGVTTLSANLFYDCYSLSSVVIPNSVTSIGSGAFSNCRGLRYCSFANHVAVPTLASTSVFQIVAKDFQIRVPAALYDEWITATNWTTYASQIVAV